MNVKRRGFITKLPAFVLGLFGFGYVSEAKEVQPETKLLVREKLLFKYSNPFNWRNIQWCDICRDDILLEIDICGKDGRTTFMMFRALSDYGFHGHPIKYVTVGHNFPILGDLENRVKLIEERRAKKKNATPTC
jgi:hypothetical protein